MSKIDERLPQTTTYWREDGIFFIKHTSFMISLAENKAITELIGVAMQDESIQGIVINTREAKGAWPQEVVEASAQDNALSKVKYSKRIATLTNGAIATMQMNRHSRIGGLQNWAKAFNSDFNEQVKAYLLKK